VWLFSTIALAYAAIKLTAYAAWCLVGLSKLGDRPFGLGRAFALGALRLAIGIAVGTTLARTMQGLITQDVARYWEVFVPVRWLEWGLIELLVVRRGNPAAGFLVGSSGRARLWRLGGIGVSCLADLPLFTLLFPLGRIWC